MMEPTIGPVRFRARLVAAWRLLTTRKKQFFYHRDFKGREVVTAVFVRDGHDGVLRWLEEVAREATNRGFKQGVRFERALRKVRDAETK